MDSVEYLKSRPLCEALFWFIENVGETHGDNGELFFALRERMRAESAVYNAAPTMLAALKQALSDHDHDAGSVLGNYSQVKAAIDSAEGR